MSTNGATAAVTGGTGTQSTPANNVGGARRVCLPYSPIRNMYANVLDFKELAVGPLLGPHGPEEK